MRKELGALNGVNEIRFVDVTNHSLIGKGMNGEVYRIDDTSALKIYLYEPILKNVKRIFDHCKIVQEKELPVAKTKEMVYTEKGYGIIFENLGSESLGDVIHSDFERVDSYIKEVVYLRKNLTGVPFADNEMIQTGDIVLEDFNMMHEVLEDTDLYHIEKYIKAVPKQNNFVHGDYQPNNILLHNDSLVLIDLDDCSIGHPIWDVACIYRNMYYMTNLCQKEKDWFLFGSNMDSYEEFYLRVNKVSISEAQLIWDIFVQNYFNRLTSDELSAIMCGIAVYSDISVVRSLLKRHYRASNDSHIFKEKLNFARYCMERMRKTDFLVVCQAFELWNKV